MYVNIPGYVSICKNRHLILREKNLGNTELCFSDALGSIHLVQYLYHELQIIGIIHLQSVVPRHDYMPSKPIAKNKIKKLTKYAVKKFAKSPISNNILGASTQVRMTTLSESASRSQSSSSSFVSKDKLESTLIFAFLTCTISYFLNSFADFSVYWSRATLSSTVIYWLSRLQKLIQKPLQVFTTRRYEEMCTNWGTVGYKDATCLQT